jgi:hypothetical protein
LRAVAETLDTGIYSEHEPQFWGFANEEEWDLAWSEMDKKAEDEFHADVIAYVKGEPNDLNEGTISAIPSFFRGPKCSWRLAF